MINSQGMADLVRQQLDEVERPEERWVSFRLKKAVYTEFVVAVNIDACPTDRTIGSACDETESEAQFLAPLVIADEVNAQARLFTREGLPKFQRGYSAPQRQGFT